MKPITEETVTSMLNGYFRSHAEFHHLNKTTLRDQFAMAALTGYMAFPDDCRSYGPNSEGTIEDFRAKCAREDAEYCYRMADAMLVAREGK